MDDNTIIMLQEVPGDFLELMKFKLPSNYHEISKKNIRVPSLKNKTFSEEIYDSPGQYLTAYVPKSFQIDEIGTKIILFLKNIKKK